MWGTPPFAPAPCVRGTMPLNSSSLHRSCTINSQTKYPPPHCSSPRTSLYRLLHMPRTAPATTHPALPHFLVICPASMALSHFCHMQVTLLPHTGHTFAACRSHFCHMQVTLLPHCSAKPCRQRALSTRHALPHSLTIVKHSNKGIRSLSLGVCAVRRAHKGGIKRATRAGSPSLQRHHMCAGTLLVQGALSQCKAHTGRIPSAVQLQGASPVRCNCKAHLQCGAFARHNLSAVHLQGASPVRCVHMTRLPWTGAQSAPRGQGVSRHACVLCACAPGVRRLR